MVNIVGIPFKLTYTPHREYFSKIIRHPLFGMCVKGENPPPLIARLNSSPNVLDEDVFQTLLATFAHRSTMFTDCVWSEEHFQVLAYIFTTKIIGAKFYCDPVHTELVYLGFPASKGSFDCLSGRLNEIREFVGLTSQLLDDVEEFKATRLFSKMLGRPSLQKRYALKFRCEGAE